MDCVLFTVRMHCLIYACVLCLYVYMHIVCTLGAWNAWTTYLLAHRVNHWSEANYARASVEIVHTIYEIVDIDMEASQCACTGSSDAKASKRVTPRARVQAIGKENGLWMHAHGTQSIFGVNVAFAHMLFLMCLRWCVGWLTHLKYYLNYIGTEWFCLVLNYIFLIPIFLIDGFCLINYAISQTNWQRYCHTMYSLDCTGCPTF